MPARQVLIQGVRYGVYVLVQVLLVGRLVLFERGWCFLYLGFVLFLPLATPVVGQLLLGFGLGHGRGGRDFAKLGGLLSYSTLRSCVRTRWPSLTRNR